MHRCELSLVSPSATTSLVALPVQARPVSVKASIDAFPRLIASFTNPHLKQARADGPASGRLNFFRDRHGRLRNPTAALLFFAAVPSHAVQPRRSHKAGARGAGSEGGGRLSP